MKPWLYQGDPSPFEESCSTEAVWKSVIHLIAYHVMIWMAAIFDERTSLHLHVLFDFLNCLAVASNINSGFTDSLEIFSISVCIFPSFINVILVQLLKLNYSFRISFESCCWSIWFSVCRCSLVVEGIGFSFKMQRENYTTSPMQYTNESWV